MRSRQSCTGLRRDRMPNRPLTAVALRASVTSHANSSQRLADCQGERRPRGLRRPAKVETTDAHVGQIRGKIGRSPVGTAASSPIGRDRYMVPRVYAKCLAGTSRRCQTRIFGATPFRCRRHCRLASGANCPRPSLSCGHAALVGDQDRPDPICALPICLLAARQGLDKDR